MKNNIPIAYIAGPYSSSKHDALERFAAARRNAYSLGYAVIDPIALTHDMDGEYPEQTFIERDLSLVTACDVLALLPGWHNSVGAMQECRQAYRSNIPVFDLYFLPPASEL